MLHFSISVLMKKQTNLHLGRPESKFIHSFIHSQWIIPFLCTSTNACLGKLNISWFSHNYTKQRGGQSVPQTHADICILFTFCLQTSYQRVVIQAQSTLFHSNKPLNHKRLIAMGTAAGIKWRLASVGSPDSRKKKKKTTTTERLGLKTWKMMKPYSAPHWPLTVTKL